MEKFYMAVIIALIVNCTVSARCNVALAQANSPLLDNCMILGCKNPVVFAREPEGERLCEEHYKPNTAKEDVDTPAEEAIVEEITPEVPENATDIKVDMIDDVGKDSAVVIEGTKATEMKTDKVTLEGGIEVEIPEKAPDIVEAIKELKTIDEIKEEAEVLAKEIIEEIGVVMGPLTVAPDVVRKMQQAYNQKLSLEKDKELINAKLSGLNLLLRDELWLFLALNGVLKEDLALWIYDNGIATRPQ